MQEERDFIIRIIDHHLAGIKMAELGEEKSEDDRVNTMMSKMASKESQELQIFLDWLAAWYDEEMEPSMNKIDEYEYEKLSVLRGEDFDASLLETMLKHHEDGIQMLDNECQESFRKDLVEMCDKIKSDQEKEIVQMQAMQEMLR